VTLDESTCRALFASARVARLATIGPRGPHLVPFVFALDGNRIISAVDHKPKRSRDLARVDNIMADPRVSVLADHYADDWDHLWWVRADGTARIVATEPALAPAIDALVTRYPQYAMQPPAGPFIEILVGRWAGWAART
jgi:PPOX class probable F420-dependent enzyme